MKNLILALLLTLPAFAARAAELTTADEVLNFALAKNAGYETYSATFAQSMNMAAMQMKLTGTISFKKPAYVRMELAGAPQHMLLVIGADQIMWQEVTIGSVTNVMKADLAHIPTNHPAAAMLKNSLNQMDPKEQLSKAKDRYAYTLLPATELSGQRMYVLAGTLRPDAQLAPQEAAVLASMGQQKLFIGQDDGFLHRLEQLDKTGTNTVLNMEFTGLKFNVPLENKLFEYRPAPDANVIDFSQIILQMMARPPQPTPATTPALAPPTGK